MIEHSNIAPSLIRSTIRQFGGFKYFKETAQDIASHGAAGGFSGFCYYSDTVPFAKRNKAAIMAYAEEQAQEIGESNALALIQGFNCLKNYNGAEIADGLYNPRSDAKTDIFNTLAWWALEEVARLYVDLTEQ